MSDKLWGLVIVGVALCSFIVGHEAKINWDDSLFESNRNNYEIPPWVKQTMHWYVEGQIGDVEMGYTIDYLINEGYIKQESTYGKGYEGGEQKFDMGFENFEEYYKDMRDNEDIVLGEGR